MKSFQHFKLPQYRQGDFGFSCATCKHMTDKTVFRCSKYNVEIDPGYVCNSWENENPESNNEKT